MNRTKKLIFESGVKVFSEKGYDGATMDEIAANAGLAKGTLYYNFKSKKEIFKYIIDEGMNLLKEQLDEAFNTEELTVDKLRNLSKVQIEIVFKNKDFIKFIISQLWGNELRHVQIRESIKGYISNIEKYIKQAIDEKVIVNEDASLMAYAFFGDLCSIAVYQIMNNYEDNIGEIIDKWMHYMLRAVKA